MVIELVTVEVASLMAEKLTIPIIGIGSGGGCDGQVLVFNDIVGLSNFELSLLTPYAKTRKKWLDAISLYRRDVESQHFPADMHCIHMEPDKIASLEKTLKDEGK